MMRRHCRSLRCVLAGLLGLALLPAPHAKAERTAAVRTLKPAPSAETVTITRRPWYPVCLGVCPFYDVTVRPDGRAWSVRHSLAVADGITELRLSRSRLARFHAALARFRPRGEDVEPAECRHGGYPGEGPVVTTAVEIAVKWSGRHSSAHIIACDTQENAALRTAIDAALRALRLDVSGRPSDWSRPSARRGRYRAAADASKTARWAANARWKAGRASPRAT
jgi:hypothetical protein